MKIILTAVLLLVSTNLVFAASTTTTVNNTVINPTAIVITEKNVLGLVFDAPKLVRVYGDWYTGVEGGKDVAYTNTSRGWFGYAKITYDGTLFTMFKSKDQDVN